MASGAVIGALRVVLGADTASLDKGLKQSQSALADFGKSVAAIAGGISLERGISSAVSALVGGVKSGIEQADKFNKLSQSVGIPVDELSKLKYAADLSDVSLESLSKSTVKLSKAMVEVAGGGTGPATEAFKALGVSVKNSDGTLRDSSDVLGDIAEKFSGYKDGAAKSALAVAIFGKAGAEMIPLLNMGRDGLKESGDEAERLGLVMGKSTTQAAENFNDNLTRLHRTADGIVILITARLLPALEDFSNKAVQASKDTSLLDKVASGIEYILKGVASVTIQVSVAFERLFAELGAFVKAYQGSDGVFSGLSAGWAAMNKEGEKTTQIMWDLKAAVAKIWDKPVAPQFDWSNLQNGIPMPKFDWEGQLSGIQAMNKEVAEYGKQWAQTSAPIIASGNASKNAFDQFITSQQKSQAAQQAEFQATGMAAGAKERLKVVLQGLAVAQANSTTLSDAQRIKLTETANAAELMALKLGNVALLGETNPFAAIGLQIDATNLKLQQGGLDAQNYAVLSGQAAQLSAKLWADSATSLAGSFESVGSSLSQMNEGWARAAKIGQAIGAAVAFVNSYVAASQAFATTPFPANIAIAAGVLAKGIAMVAAIKGAAMPTGMMTGGSFMVGGSGGPDSQLVNLALSPGEQVDVWRPDEGGGADPRGGGSRSGGKTVVLNGFVWGRDQMRDMFDFLNEGLRDGHKIDLKFA